MRRSIILSALLALVVNLCAQSSLPENGAWWGFWNSTQRLCDYETLSSGTSNCAIRLIGASQPELRNTRVHGLRFYISDKTAVVRARAWLSTRTFGNTASDTEPNLAVKEIDLSTLLDYDHDRQPTEVYFDKPTDILPSANPYAGIYAGVTLEIRNGGKSAILTTDEITSLSANSNFYNFASVADDYGPLALQLLLSGDALRPDGLSPTAFGADHVLLDATTLPLSVTTDGTTHVRNFDFTIDWGEPYGTQPTTHITLPTGDSSQPQGGYPEMNQTYTIDIPISLPSAARYYEGTLRITAVNSHDNSSDHPTLALPLTVFSKAAVKRVVMEEFTGAWCPNCPRGMVGMALLEEAYGDRFIGIAVHNGDPMALPEYDQSAFKRRKIAILGGYPSCTIDRAIDCDPYTGTTTQPHFLTDIEVERRATQTVPADISLTPTWTDATCTKIHCDVSTTFHYSSDSNAPYSIMLVLVADSLTGSSDDWLQVNKYATEGGAFPDPDMNYWNNAGKYVATAYNHVPVAVAGVDQGIAGSISTPLVCDQSQHFGYDLDISTNTLIQSKDHLAAVAMLLDTRTGHVVNAARTHLPTTASVAAIGQISADPLQQAGSGSTPSVFDLQGRPRQSAGTGFNIIRTSDGKAHKLFVR